MGAIGSYAIRVLSETRTLRKQLLEVERQVAATVKAQPFKTIRLQTGILAAALRKLVKVEPYASSILQEAKAI